MMPKVSGFDVAAILKNDPDLMQIPIIILSIVEDKERGYRLGVNRYLQKPVDEAVLVKEIESIFHEDTGQGKVLVMDEEETVLTRISARLTEKGYHVIQASSNKELMVKALENKPDMIVVTSISEEQENIVKTLRYEEGLEHIYIMLYE
jgi:DNA-binding response OmpR family regulator